MDRNATLQLDSMPPGKPAFSKGPWHFGKRQYNIVVFESDPKAIAAQVPGSVRMAATKSSSRSSPCRTARISRDTPSPASSFPACSATNRCNFVHEMYLDNVPAIILGREVWGFPKTEGNPSLEVKGNTSKGELVKDGALVARSTMEYKHKDLPARTTISSMRGKSPRR